MRGIRILALVAAPVLTAAACGDDTGEATPSTALTTVATAAPTTAAPATTTTTAAPTTTTTTPIDAHPVFGLSWAAVWPADGATAVYRVTNWDQSQEDVPAIIEYGVDFRGETFDRLTIGTPEPGNNSMVVYLDRSEPWKVGIKAVVTYDKDQLGGPIIAEVFDTPTVFDGSLPLDESSPSDVEIVLEFGDMDERMPATYDLMLVAVGENVDVPLGTVTNTALFHGSVGGEEFIGGTEPFVAEIWVHPEHMIVKMIGAPAFDAFEIVETWG